MDFFFLFLTSCGAATCVYTWLLLFTYFLFTVTFAIIDVFLVINIFFSFFVGSSIVELSRFFSPLVFVRFKLRFFFTSRRFRLDPRFHFFTIFTAFRLPTPGDFLGEPANFAFLVGEPFFKLSFWRFDFIFVSCISSCLFKQLHVFCCYISFQLTIACLKTKSTRNNRPFLPSFHI